MGLDDTGIEFLKLAVGLGLDPSRTLMVGRQQLHHVRHALPYSHGSYADDYLRSSIGAGLVESLDLCDPTADYCCDFGRPLPEKLWGRYSLVIDGGTLEHVLDATEGLRNVHRLLAMGGTYLGIHPANGYVDHGYWQVSPQLMYDWFHADRGYKTSVWLGDESGLRCRVLRPDGTRREMSVGRCYAYTCARKVRQEDVSLATIVQSDYARGSRSSSDSAST